MFKKIYSVQFKGKGKVFNSLECLILLFTGPKTLHVICELHLH